MYASPYDGATVTLSVLVLNPVTVGVLLLAIRVAGANPVEYLALVWPRTRDLIVGVVGIVIIIAATDAILYLSGRRDRVAVPSRLVPQRPRRKGGSRCCFSPP